MACRLRETSDVWQTPEGGGSEEETARALNLPPERLEQLRRLNAMHDLYERLANALAYSIHEHDDIKKGMSCSLLLSYLHIQYKVLDLYGYSTLFKCPCVLSLSLTHSLSLRFRSPPRASRCRPDRRSLRWSFRPPLQTPCSQLLICSPTRSLNSRPLLFTLFFCSRCALFQTVRSGTVLSVVLISSV